MKILDITHVSKYYGQPPHLIKVLDDISLSIEQEEFVVILGASGSGKSTLFHLLGGLDYPSIGSINVDKFKLRKFSEDDLTVFRRRRIGFLFQNYNLIPTLNVYENIVLPIYLDKKTPNSTFIQEIITFLELEKKLYQIPYTLSGEQQQRVAIARALANRPAIILADEPTGNFDQKTSEGIIQLLKTTNQKFHQTIIIITHNPEIAKQAEQGFFIKNGKLKKL